MNEILIPSLLAIQGAVGGVDTLLNHEWLERLPKRPEARGEIGLHSIREATYATLFAGFAWFDMQGAVCALVAALLAPRLLEAWPRPTALIAHDFGALSWLLTAFAALGVFWCVRDFLAWLRLGRA